MLARLTVVVILVVAIFCGQAVAQDKVFGLGVLLGEPIGLTGKWWLTRTIAIDGAVAWSFAGDGGVQLHADVLYHKFDLLNINEDKLAVYFGIGPRVKVETDDGDTVFAIRFPVGINYIYAEKRPLDLFFELVPVLDLAPRTRFAFNAAVGVRYFFR